MAIENNHPSSPRTFRSAEDVHTPWDFTQGEIFAVDKPYGVTSFGALARVRYLLTQRLGRKVKIGHAGTLDPLATGVLVLCTGRCTKQIEELQAHTKTYEATLQLGATTPSYDLEHPVDATFPTEHITLQAVQDVLQSFVGEVEQVPPSYSACKVAGNRAYELRRKGEEVELQAKRIRIDQIELLHYDTDQQKLRLRVTCGKGTYIRALARDVGRALHSGAHLTALRRIQSGKVHVEQCVNWEQLEQWTATVPLASGSYNTEHTARKPTSQHRTRIIAPKV